MGRNRRRGDGGLTIKVALGVFGGLAAFVVVAGWLCLSWWSYQRAERRRADDEYEGKLREQDRREEAERKAKEDRERRAYIKKEWAERAADTARREKENDELPSGGLPEGAQKTIRDFNDRSNATNRRFMEEMEREARERWQKHPRDL